MSRRILVVDDEKLIVKGLKFSLEQEGMQVDCAYDGEEALAYAQQNQLLVHPFPYYLESLHTHSNAPGHI